MNQICCIRPYKYQGIWVFDDERVGLMKEPFVCGSDVLIDWQTEDFNDAEDGFRLFFSAAPFPSSQLRLLRGREDCGGYWYEEVDTGHEGWLCPALFRYFETAPPELYAAFQP